MAQVERIFDMMKAGQSWDEIIKTAGKSSIYAGFIKYLPWAQQHVEDLQAEITTSEETVRSLNEDARKVKNSIEANQREVGNLETIKTKLSNENGSLTEQLQKLQKHFNEIEMKRGGLHNLGVTDEAIARVGKIQFRDGDELQDRLVTLDEYVKLRDETRNLNDRKVIDLKEYESLEQHIASLRKEIVAENNSLDEAKRKRWIWEQAQEVMLSFFSDGYDTELLLSLKTALNALAVKGSPKVTIRRLLDGLAKSNGLTEYEAAVRRKRSELTTVNSEIERVKGILGALQSDIITRIQKVAADGSRCIEATGKTARDEVSAFSSETRKAISGVAAVSQTEVQTFGKIAVTELQKADETCRQALLNIDRNVKQKLERYNVEVNSWGIFELRWANIQKFFSMAIG